MLKCAIAILLALLGLFPPTVSGEEASNVHFDLDITTAYYVQENYLRRYMIENINDIHFSKNRSYGLVNLHPNLSLRASNHVHGYLGADVTWENPVDEGQDDETDTELTTAYLSLKGKGIRADIGIQPVELGGGFIMADSALAAVIHGGRGGGYAEFKAARIYDNSPMAGVTLGYRPGYFERIELFGIWFSDADDTFANSLRYVYNDDTPTYTLPTIYQILMDASSEGTLYYFGAAADLFVGNALLSFVGAYQTGEYTFSYLNNRRTGGDVNAYFGDISIERNLTDWSTLGIFCHLASGDDTPRDSELNAFVSVMPYNPRAALFFDPDFMANNDDDRFTYGDGFFGGVIAPGISLTLLSEWGLSAEAALIYLYADQKLNDGSQFYGWEADLVISYIIGTEYRFFVETARFEHGDYFESLLDEKIEPAFKFAVGMQATF